MYTNQGNIISKVVDLFAVVIRRRCRALCEPDATEERTSSSSSRRRRRGLCSAGPTMEGREWSDLEGDAMDATPDAVAARTREEDAER